MSIENRLQQLGLELPTPPKPAGNYVPAVQTGNLLFMSGVGPRLPDGSSITGTVGADLSTEQGIEAARLVGLNMLSNIQLSIGSLDRVVKVVKVLGMVNSAPDFTEMPRVINGFSDLFVEVFGDDIGRGARSAVGMVALPIQIAVEVEMILEVN